MEPHPVPKNILTVEFKLFGALTVKQFGKVLIGSLVALGIFMLNLPGIIGIPLMVASVLLGIFAALVKDFEVRAVNFLRSLFVSPRYVWEKMEKTPEALQREQAKKKASTTSKKFTKQTDVDIHDITLDRLLDARAAQQAQTEPDSATGGDNFSRVYGDMYQADVQAAKQQPQRPEASNVSSPPLAESQDSPQPPPVGIVDQPSQNQQPLAEQPALNQRIAELQNTLNEMNKQNASPEQKQPILDEINSIYSRLKGAAEDQLPPEQVEPLDKKRMFYGITVTTSEQPVPGAQVSLKRMDGQQVGSSVSGEDGRFALESLLPPGDYLVHVTHPNKRFPEFKLSLGEGQLPAYKFREG